MADTQSSPHTPADYSAIARVDARSNEGFTLIELSIVLVIIGLIIGGVLVGRDLIKAGEIRKTIAEMDKVTAAVNVFKLKYNCLAGDCANATQFFGAGAQPDQTTNGDGSGAVDSGSSIDTSGAYISTERAYFFDHLANAKLINLSTFDEVAADMSNITAGNGHPKTPIGNGFMVFNALGDGSSGYAVGGGHAFLLGVMPSLEITPLGFYTADADGLQSIAAPDAFAIDSKLDDGKPLSGKVVTLIGASEPDPEVTVYLEIPAAPGSGSCASDASGNPYSSNKDDTCALSIKAGF